MLQRNPKSDLHYDLSQLKSYQAFDHLAGEIARMAIDHNLGESAEVDAAATELIAFNTKAQELINLASLGQFNEVSVLIGRLRENNLLARFYRAVIQHEGIDLRGAGTLLERTADIWNAFLCDAAIAGFRHSQHAVNDDAWWQLFKNVTDSYLGIAVLHECIHQRASEKENGRVIHACFTSDNDDDLLVDILLSINIDELTKEDRDKFDENLLAVSDADEIGRAHLLQAMHVAGDFDAFLKQLNVARNQFNIAFHLYKDQCLPSAYNPALIDAHAPQNMRHLLVVRDKKYVHTVIEKIEIQMKEPEDLRWAIRSISDPLLLANIIRFFQPRLEKTLQLDVNIQGELGVLLRDVVRLAVEAGLAGDPATQDAMFAVNELRESLRAIRYFAGHSLSLELILQKMRQNNLLLALYACIPAKEGSDRAVVSLMQERIQRVWSHYFMKINHASCKEGVSQHHAGLFSSREAGQQTEISSCRIASPSPE